MTATAILPRFICHKTAVEPVTPQVSPDVRYWHGVCDQCEWRGVPVVRMDAAMADAYEHMQETGIEARL